MQRRIDKMTATSSVNGSQLISIIMPTFQHGHCISRSIQSVLDQTYESWELIIIDNHSVDNTSDIVLSFKDPRIKYLKFPNNGIIAASRNHGVLISKGDWIAFLDSDDWWEQSKLQASMQFANNKNADIVYHDLFLAKHPKQKFFLSKARGREINGSVFENLLTHGNALFNSSVMVKKEILEKVGGISEEKSKVSWEDFDCWLKISRVTNKFFYLNVPLGYYWVGGGNTSTPKVILENTSSIENSYQVFFANSLHKPFWLGNGRGKAFLELRMYDQAIAEFKSIDGRIMTYAEWLRFHFRIAQSYTMKYKEYVLSFFKNI